MIRIPSTYAIAPIRQQAVILLSVGSSVRAMILLMAGASQKSARTRVSGVREHFVECVVLARVGGVVQHCYRIARLHTV